MNGYTWLNDLSLRFLQRDYLLPGQSVDDRVNIICATAEHILGKSGFASRFRQNLQKGWYSLSTPIWTNFGTDRGLPISCFGSFIEDNMASIAHTHAEVMMMTKHGGGTSAYFGELRPRGAAIRDNGTSSGAVHFMRPFDNLISIVSQGQTRRGNFAAYLPIDHPDIDEFLSIRSEGNPIQDLSFGVCVPDDWLRAMIDGNQQHRRVWARVLQARTSTGYPYILFTDTANRCAPDCYRNQQYRIRSSNLCSEIMLPAGADESFVCDLSSMNIIHWDAWKDTDAVELLVYFLDAVMTDFIDRASKIPFLERAVRFARRHRALGIGWLGWHSYLQHKMIAFESVEAQAQGAVIARTIGAQAHAASQKMATEYGEPEVLRGYGRRHTTLTAIAPTKSSSFILGQASEGIEPHRANYYIKDLQKGKFTVKNPHLQELLQRRGKDTDSTWRSILEHAGSVSHLHFLSEHEKVVFRTFAEIAPLAVIRQAAARQKYVDQSQSLNLMIHPQTPVRDVNALYIEAWRLDVKTLYYQLGINAAQQFSRNIMSCASCES